MIFTELKKSLENGERFSAYLIEGEDAYFRLQATKALESAFVKEPALNVAVFDSDNFDPGDVLASLNAFPILSENRMTVIKEFYPKADALKGGLREFLENPPKNSVLAVVNEKPHDALKKFPSVCTVSCEKADIGTVSRWIKATAIASGVNVSDTNARKIAEFCLSDMLRVKNETEKLIAYAGAGGEITEQAVDLLVFRDSEYKVYEMTEYIAKKNFDLAVKVVNDMLDKGDVPQKVITSVYNYFRRLLFVSVSDGTDAETASLLGIKEFAVKKARQQASAFRVRSLKKAVDGLAEADYAIKSGRTDANDALWINIFKIMTE